MLSPRFSVMDTSVRRHLFIDPAGSNVTGVQYQTLNDAFAFLADQENSWTVRLKDGITHNLVGNVTMPTVLHPVIGVSKTTTVVDNKQYSFDLGQYGKAAFHRVKAISAPVAGVSAEWLLGNQHTLPGKGTLRLQDMDFVASGAYSKQQVRLMTKEIAIANVTMNTVNSMPASDFWCDKLTIDGLTMAGTSSVGELLSFCAGPVGSDPTYDEHGWEINNLQVTGTSMSGLLIYLQTSYLQTHLYNKHVSLRNSTIKAITPIAETVAIYTSASASKPFEIDVDNCVIEAGGGAGYYEFYKEPAGSVSNVVINQKNTTRADLVSACRVG